jgi:LacI family transcriptional regulator
MEITDKIIDRSDIEKIGIDRTSKKPVFKQIYDILFEEMKGGFYDQAGRLPSEKELCLRFDVERNTIRKALQILVDENRIARVPGIGTKLLPDSSPLDIEQVQVFSRGVKRIIKKNNIILLITQVDYLHTPDSESFHFKLIHSFERSLSRLGYNLLFKPIGQDGIFADTIRSAMPQGIIFDSFNPDSYYREAAGFGLPCVSVNHYTPLFTSIVSNNFEGAYQVTRELVDAGHKRIAFITGKSSHQTNIERLNGVQALCNSRDIPLINEYLILGDWTFGSGAEEEKKILAMKTSIRPTAIFAFNDDLAYGCYSVLRSRGVSVPSDMSLVGFDKSDRYVVMFPPITTMDVNIKAIVDYACWYLSSSLSGWTPAGQAKIQIETTICNNRTIEILK